MNLALFSLLLLTLQSAKGSDQEAGSYRTLQQNVLVVTPKVDSSAVQVPLQCGESYGDRKIVWRSKNGVVGEGNRINVTVEEMFGGNYSCHDDTGYLNHTLVLVQGSKNAILENSDSTDPIQCLSNNYSGHFQCSWKWSHGRKGDVLLVTVTRSSVEINCTVDPSGQSIACRDHTHCPYVEEVERITLTLHVKRGYRVDIYKKYFYISEIGKPDGISITKVGNTYKWEYPETWSVPHSYFPLTFEVKMIHLKHNCDCKSKVCISKNIQTTDRHWPVREKFLFCIRAQDALCNSSWSDWSQAEPYKKKSHCDRRSYNSFVCNTKSCCPVGHELCFSAESYNA
ncbi:hypothetical protein AAFF_G00309580 [Aldrovandia affinis]|uniref:Interleukin-12 subunit beta n=1 Tax=Aldrovandia affinis TaxID=143900 RepID=A0AAD7SNY3_9TELE|nr:hypothetical protein AAFF_G00309580 [Aldrovandia affinis]